MNSDVLTIVWKYGKGDMYDGISFKVTKESIAKNPDALDRLHNARERDGIASFLKARGVDLRNVKETFPQIDISVAEDGSVISQDMSLDSEEAIRPLANFVGMPVQIFFQKLSPHGLPEFKFEVQPE